MHAGIRLLRWPFARSSRQRLQAVRWRRSPAQAVAPWSASAPWLSPAEPFPAATVLEDLCRDSVGETAAEGTARVIARYVALKAVLAGSDARAANERHAALGYLQQLADGDAERWALSAALRAQADRDAVRLVARLADAAGLAAERGHGRGAFALAWTGHLSAAPRDPAGAARCAGRLARLARGAGDEAAVAIWRRREAALRERAVGPRQPPRGGSGS